MTQGVGRMALFGMLFTLPISIIVILSMRGSAIGDKPEAIDLLMLGVYGGVGGLVIFRRDGHPVGWLLAGLGAVVTSVTLLDEAAIVPIAIRDWAGTVGWPVVFFLLAIICLVFPSGHLPTGDGFWPRVARRLATWFMPGTLALIVGAGLISGPISGRSSDALLLYPMAVVMPILGGSAISLLIRKRRAVGAERAQLAWVIFPLVVLGVVSVLTMTVIMISAAVGIGIPGDAVFTPLAILFLAFPVAFGVAVLRYKLYEIDRIISRTVSYTLLTAVLAALYLGAVFVFNLLFPQQSDLTVAASTLLAAAAFNPFRRRIQSAVDRKFNRSRFDAERTLEALSKRLAVEVNLEQLGRELGRVASETMQPRALAIWLR